MNAITDFLARLLGTALKLLLSLAALVLVLSVLATAVLVVLAVSVWSLLTGRKATPSVVFGRFRATSDRVTRGVWPHRNRPEGPRRAPGDVVDVQAHEVPDDGASHADGASPDKKPGEEPVSRFSRLQVVSPLPRRT